MCWARMSEVVNRAGNHKKFVELMMKKTHFTENEVERLLDLFGKTVVGFVTDRRNTCLTANGAK